MLCIKRSVQAQFNTELSYLAAHALAVNQGAAKDAEEAALDPMAAAERQTGVKAGLKFASAKQQAPHNVDDEHHQVLRPALRTQTRFRYPTRKTTGVVGALHPRLLILFTLSRHSLCLLSQLATTPPTAHARRVCDVSEHCNTRRDVANLLPNPFPVLHELGTCADRTLKIELMAILDTTCQ
jgi:hypothetical protein